MQKIVTFLWFNDQAEEAAQWYTRLFKNSKINTITRFGDDTPGPKGKVMTVDFQLAGQTFSALNGGPDFSFTPAISFFVDCQTEEEVDTLWSELSEGGAVLMEFGQYPFSEKFGWLQDRYGVSWQLSLSGVPQRITPYWLFVGAQFGRAEEAINQYTALFEDSRIDHLERFGKDQGEPEGGVMHARFTLHGQQFMAMDSSQQHNFTFTPAISFLVSCRDQAEVDHYWEQLSAGGEKGPCGWLTDRFGMSWQVIPTILTEMINDPDAERANRVTQAMLKMSKIDIAQLEQAYQLATPGM